MCVTRYSARVDDFRKSIKNEFVWLAMSDGLLTHTRTVFYWTRSAEFRISLEHSLHGSRVYIYTGNGWPPGTCAGQTFLRHACIHIFIGKSFQFTYYYRTHRCTHMHASAQYYVQVHTHTRARVYVFYTGRAHRTSNVSAASKMEFHWHRTVVHHSIYISYLYIHNIRIYYTGGASLRMIIVMGPLTLAELNAPDIRLFIRIQRLISFAWISITRIMLHYIIYYCILYYVRLASVKKTAR